ncbi:hypothetical protein O7606_20810 [Micromonospora sp. WMMD882]|uniref:hypothetical protein n=1 Tax=Micromonospora sp. WMMD882 TaxID=3015151 RepID=UPI00248AE085|nr:hypothetical protein [Micromonospora sp. WMMD882]WBB78629.1 hypothetical protein O7606_20810 [Micromonospora sp. WMMD882]
MTKELLPGGGTVFGIGRRKTQGQLAKAELNRSVGHLVQAASYASRGVGQTVGPRVQSARTAVTPTAVLVRDRATRGWGSTVATLTPLAVAARGGAAQAGTVAKKAKAKNMRIGKAKKKTRRGGMMTGLLAAGAVAGVAGALALRRRRDQQEWSEYAPARTEPRTDPGTLEPMRDEVETIEVRTPAAPKSTGDQGPVIAGGPTGAGSSAVAKGDSASTTKPAAAPTVTPNDQVPSVAEGARDVTGRPADDISRAMGSTGSRR